MRLNDVLRRIAEDLTEEAGTVDAAFPCYLESVSVEVFVDEEAQVTAEDTGVRVIVRLLPYRRSLPCI